MSKNKVTGRYLAGKLGIPDANISMVVHGKRKTKYIREAIAKAINKPVSEVFPDTDEVK